VDNLEIVAVEESLEEVSYLLLILRDTWERVDIRSIVL